jgi:Ca2+-binding RTX toxin-like protein
LLLDDAAGTAGNLCRTFSLCFNYCAGRQPIAEAPMSFFMRTSFNGRFLQLQGDTDGSLSIRSRSVNGNTTVTFSSSDDLTVNGSGNLNATIIGGAENDTFNFSAATGNYNFRTGAGNDVITGGSGNDSMTGGIGDDTMTGRGGNDLFVFAAGSGDDTITDFKQPGADRIDLSAAAFNFQNITDVQNQATTVGTTTTIDLGGGDTVQLLNVNENTLVAADFIF